MRIITVPPVDCQTFDAVKNGSEICILHEAVISVPGLHKKIFSHHGIYRQILTELSGGIGIHPQCPAGRQLCHMGTQGAVLALAAPVEENAPVIVHADNDVHRGHQCIIKEGRCQAAFSAVRAASGRSALCRMD